MNINRIEIFVVLFFIIISGSCKNEEIISRKDYIDHIDKAFTDTKILAANRSDKLFSVINDSTDKEIARALKFYYSSMPLSDLADYDGEYFLANVQQSFEAYREFAWSKYIPEDIFLHFVLPVRVNNENLDNFRINYYSEIKERIKDIDNIEEAALEINHWCHEKVSYQSADIRTSSPESTILSARGRCGEESTFTVAALRAACIPARQVYVPRWAHSDDNHAWVEVWVNGDWKYLGACEPDAELDRGWFTGPASRAMLVHTLTFGRYFGNESLVKSLPEYSEINNLANYADTRKINLIVIDADSNRVDGASVIFGQLNYAEFYPLAKLKTDSKGECSFITGRGDIFVWIEAEGNFSFAEIDSNDNNPVLVLSGNGIQSDMVFTYEISAPPSTRSDAALPEAVREYNTQRLKSEDSIRHAYIASWPGDSEISGFLSGASYNNIDKFLPIVKSSMGNYREIYKLLKMVDEINRPDALNLLQIIAEKDLRDSRAETLFDHVVNARRYYNNEYPEEVFIKYILNPRIANEIISPWRLFIQNQQDDQTVEAFRKRPTILSEWMNENLQLVDERNYYGVPITPQGVLELGVTDTRSRDILFVACCRACGIPARLEPGTDLPQYMINGEWNDPYFTDRGRVKPRSANLSFTWSNTGPEPEYYRHFTIAGIKEGKYSTLKYDYYKKAGEFSEPLKLSPGSYMLTTCSRPDDSMMLASISFFELIEDENFELSIEPTYIPDDETRIASLRAQTIKAFTGDKFDVKDMLSKQAVFAWIDPEKEPSKHLLNEIQSLKTEFDNWGGKFVFLSDPSKISRSFNIESYKNLPLNYVFAQDPDYQILNNTFPDMGKDFTDLPVVIFVDNDQSVIFKSSGYKIGYGNQLYYLAQKR